MDLIGLAAKHVAENRQHGCHYAEGTCDECREIAAGVVAALFKANAGFDALRLCPECGAPMGEHMLGGPYHPRPVTLPKPSSEAVRLVHKIRTYGHSAEFALTDIEAARTIDSFSADKKY